MLTDPISDFLIRIRNASHARRGELVTPMSNAIKAIADVLVKKRFIESYEPIDDGKNNKQIHIVLRVDRDPLEVKRVSKPGQRIYIGHKEVKRVRNGLGIGIISTSKGVMTDEEARQSSVGGEYVCEIY